MHYSALLSDSPQHQSSARLGIGEEVSDGAHTADAANFDDVAPVAGFWALTGVLLDYEHRQVDLAVEAANGREYLARDDGRRPAAGPSI